MEYSIIDSQMTNKNKKALVEIANGFGYDYYSEMLHKMHTKEDKRPHDISRLLYDSQGNMLTTKESIYSTLKKYGWLIRQKRKYSNYVPIKGQKVCICCEKAPVHPDLHRLCMAYYKSDGAKRGGNACNFNPFEEYSNGAAMYGMSL